MSSLTLQEIQQLKNYYKYLVFFSTPSTSTSTQPNDPFESHTETYYTSLVEKLPSTSDESADFPQSPGKKAIRKVLTREECIDLFGFHTQQIVNVGKGNVVEQDDGEEDGAILGKMAKLARYERLGRKLLAM